MAHEDTIMKPATVIIALGCILLTLLPSYADDSRLILQDYGIYSNGVVLTNVTFEEGVQVYKMTNLVLSCQTNVVHAGLGSNVGFRFERQPATQPQIILNTIRPPMPVVDASSHQTNETYFWRAELDTAKGEIGFRFEELSECVSGKWLFKVQLEGGPSLSKEITILFDKNGSPNTGVEPTR